ncbi:hypothetical protein H6G00_00705 [Leptolyngbya sp. FACHB-541]|uniref:hypothetical protein n=1 Tax=Leptolyngbya sp. FACHB-541 TaxID=2692810 RepID=UPI00168399AE|nr:hypothetical protein [Leptolyngbya sp. FACHB-541]MBD1995147.1 hypothetical protein [Leptolyngbya sp. FACHB-541]
MKINLNGLTDFLYARPSFIEGIARLMDFGGTLEVYNTTLPREQVDGLALAADWMAIGGDLETVMKQYLEGQEDLEDARGAKAEAQEKGTVSLETFKQELGL